MTIIENEFVPDSAFDGDKWINTFDERKYFVCTGDYSNVTSELVVDAANLPGSTNLTFSAIDAGGEGDLIDVVTLNAGVSGTSTLLKTGSGIPSDHFVYTFSLFDNDNSNNSVILLLSGDPDLAVSGTDATNGTFVPITGLSLSGAIVNWREVVIHIDYVAVIPKITDPTKEVNPSLSNDIKNNLPEILAATLLDMDEGGDKNLSAKLEYRFNVAKSRSVVHRNRGTSPDDVYPS